LAHWDAPFTIAKGSVVLYEAHIRRKPLANLGTGFPLFIYYIGDEGSAEDFVGHSLRQRFSPAPEFPQEMLKPAEIFASVCHKGENPIAKSSRTEGYVI
jgi:hypothetical protein